MWIVKQTILIISQLFQSSSYITTLAALLKVNQFFLRHESLTIQYIASYLISSHNQLYSRLYYKVEIKCFIFWDNYLSLVCNIIHLQKLWILDMIAINNNYFQWYLQLKLTYRHAHTDTHIILCRYRHRLRHTNKCSNTSKASYGDVQ